jgi:c(7)-type cytochrome triheme protein
MVLLHRLAVGFTMLILLVNVALAVQGDVVFKRKGGNSGTPVAVFPHWIHRIRYKCYVCHPDPFEMKAGANEVTMEAIMAGKSCGMCHNGKIAWGATFDTCSRCHVGK